MNDLTFKILLMIIFSLFGGFCLGVHTMSWVYWRNEERKIIINQQIDEAHK